MAGNDRDNEEYWNTGPTPPRFPWRDDVALPSHDDGSKPHMEQVGELGLSGIIDAHCHWFPENVTTKIWDYFQQRHWPITYCQPPEERLDWLRRNGVLRFTTLNYAHRAGMAEWLNDWTVEFAAKVPEAIPCGTFYPEPEVGRYVRRTIEEFGFKGFKLHLHVGQFDPAQELLYPAFEQIEHAGLPVVIHSGNQPMGGPFTDISYIRKLLSRYPDLKLVIAHMGAGEFAEYLDLAIQYESVSLDSTMVFVDFMACHDYPSDLISKLVDHSDILLFGSDFPNIPYPFSHAVLGLLQLPFTDTQARQVLLKNAGRLFDLDGMV